MKRWQCTRKPVDLIEEIRDDHPDVAVTYVNMGILYHYKLNKYKEALPSTERP